MADETITIVDEGNAGLIKSPEKAYKDTIEMHEQKETKAEEIQEHKPSVVEKVKEKYNKYQSERNERRYKEKIIKQKAREEERKIYYAQKEKIEVERAQQRGMQRAQQPRGMAGLISNIQQISKASKGVIKPVKSNPISMFSISSPKSSRSSKPMNFKMDFGSSRQTPKSTSKNSQYPSLMPSYSMGLSRNTTSKPAKMPSFSMGFSSNKPKKQGKMPRFF